MDAVGRAPSYGPLLARRLQAGFPASLSTATWNLELLRPVSVDMIGLCGLRVWLWSSSIWANSGLLVFHHWSSLAHKASYAQCCICTNRDQTAWPKYRWVLFICKFRTHKFGGPILDPPRHNWKHRPVTSRGLTGPDPWIPISIQFDICVCVCVQEQPARPYCKFKSLVGKDINWLYPTADHRYVFFLWR